MKLDSWELNQIIGGNGYGIAAGIGAAIAFLISIVEGFINPIKCN